MTTEQIIKIFLKNRYLIQIFPFPSGYAVAAMNFGVQGAHYTSNDLDDAFQKLYEHMKKDDKNLDES